VSDFHADQDAYPATLTLLHVCSPHQNAGLATIVRYAWWCQYHNVEGGMGSIRNYVSAASEWCQAMGCPDPRKIEPWVYDRFKREAPRRPRLG
jgi:hypothetical protein